MTAGTTRDGRNRSAAYRARASAPTTRKIGGFFASRVFADTEQRLLVSLQSNVSVRETVPGAHRCGDTASRHRGAASQRWPCRLRTSSFQCMRRDSERREFHRECSNPSSEPRFRCPVNRCKRDANPGRVAAHRHDPPRASHTHRGKQLSGEAHRAEKVHLKNVSAEVRRRVLKRCERAKTSVVHDCIQRYISEGGGGVVD